MTHTIIRLPAVFVVPLGRGPKTEPRVAPATQIIASKQSGINNLFWRYQERLNNVTRSIPGI